MFPLFEVLFTATRIVCLQNIELLKYQKLSLFWKARNRFPVCSLLQDMTTSAKLEYELINADLQKSCVYAHLINAVFPNIWVYIFLINEVLMF